MVSVKFDVEHGSDNAPDLGQKIKKIPDELPILPVSNMVVFPFMVTPVTVEKERSVRLIEEVSGGNRLIGVITVKDAKADKPGPETLYQVGVAAQILRLIRGPNGEFHLLIQGIEKIAVENWTQEQPFLKARVRPVAESVPGSDHLEAEALRGNLVELYKKVVSLVSSMTADLVESVSQVTDYRQLAYLIASTVRMDLQVAQSLLEMDDVLSKLLKLTEIINRELEVLELGRKIQSDAKTEMDKAQREYYLRQQLKAIQKELGEDDSNQIKAGEFRQKIEDSGMSEEARKEALRELDRMEKLPEASAEYGVIMTYLDWMTSLPWKKSTDDILDIDYAREVLDEDHYNLVKVKERILEYLAVKKLGMERKGELEKESGTDRIRLEREGVILCFSGPPGLGKTSLGQSIARALGRQFQRISLGGMRDEAEIRGHRRTYIGAMPGRFIQAMRRCGTKNPVILLDEVDKVGSDWRGDPSSALLEVLDPEQNRSFRDHYLDVSFDLSQVMFIATANVLDAISAPLRDRLEIIPLSGYTDEEKLNIVQRYLLPRQKRENNLKRGEISLTDEAVYKIIREYTREAGVRGLERQVGTICRKVAAKVAERKAESIRVDQSDLIEYLGQAPFAYDAAARTALPGVATGLAVTAVGGDILFVEVAMMPGKKGLKVTGQLGDVMKESAEAAVSYVRARAENLGVDSAFFDNHDLHIHIPAGAIPKDGPSAGVTLVTALTSLLTQRPVRADVGMTGEITLRGYVLPVGGIKDKVLAAHRAGLKTVILPERNQKDLEDLPEAVREEMRFIMAENIDTVLEHALEP